MPAARPGPPPPHGRSLSLRDPSAARGGAGRLPQAVPRRATPSDRHRRPFREPGPLFRRSGRKRHRGLRRPPADRVAAPHQPLHHHHPPPPPPTPPPPYPP